MTEAVVRPAARVVVFDPDAFVLLQLVRDPGGGEWWITPGGALEEGESARDAALRELVEEIGLRDIELGPEIWTRRHVFEWDGRRYDQRETFFICRLEERHEAVPTVDAAQLAAEGIVEHRWWGLEELASADVETAPRRLPALLRALLEEGPPVSPIDVGV